MSFHTPQPMTPNAGPSSSSNTSYFGTLTRAASSRSGFGGQTPAGQGGNSQQQQQPQHQHQQQSTSSFQQQQQQQPPSTSKAVRWGDQTPQAGAVGHSSSTAMQPTSTPQKPAAGSSTPQSSTSQSQSLAKSIASSSISKPVAAPSPSAQQASSSAVKTMTTTAASPSSLRTRASWNGGALAALYIVPRLSVSRSIYWSFLDVTHSLFGGHSDETIAGVTAWLHWALLIVFLVNLGESLVMLRLGPQGAPSGKPKQRPSLSTPPGYESIPPPTSAPPPTPAAPSSSSRRVSGGAAGSYRTPTRFNPNSPLRASLQAASRSVSGGFSSPPSYTSSSSEPPTEPSSVSSNSFFSAPAPTLTNTGNGTSIGAGSGSSPLNPESTSYLGPNQPMRRFPSGPPTSSTPISSSSNVSSASASPLAAYLARRGYQAASRDFVDLSSSLSSGLNSLNRRSTSGSRSGSMTRGNETIDADLSLGEEELSSDALQVERALRALEHRSTSGSGSGGASGSSSGRPNQAVSA